jgi:hypothetical protein
VKLDVLRQRDHHDRRELDDLHEIAGEKMKVLTKMDEKKGEKKGDHLMVALDDRYLTDRC